MDLFTNSRLSSLAAYAAEFWNKIFWLAARESIFSTRSRTESGCAVLEERLSPLREGELGSESTLAVGTLGVRRTVEDLTLVILGRGAPLSEDPLTAGLDDPAEPPGLGASGKADGGGGRGIEGGAEATVGEGGIELSMGAVFQRLITGPSLQLHFIFYFFPKTKERKRRSRRK